jgi:peptidoglycan/xylan/chitin deacetylase (PgdA/CDA1 family)
MTPLSTGDAILVVDGHDQVEGERKVVVRLPGRHLGDPQRTLGRYRIRRIRVVGAVSGEVLATRDLLRGRGVTHDEVALTFDDGPWPVQTAAVVRILERHRAPATFFMVGYLAERYPGIVRMVARAGMRIGNHSWDHPVDPPLAEMTDARVVEEIGRTQETLATLGVHSRLFRPPGGSWDIAVQRETERQGMRIVLWSVDPKDWSPNATSGRIVRRVLDAVRPGSVVLLHDGGGDRSATIRALPKIIRGIRAMGLRLVAIPNQA